MSSAMSAGSLKDAIPSHNDEAEVATIGAVLIDTEALPAIIHLVRPEDFYKGAHQRISRLSSPSSTGGSRST